MVPVFPNMELRLVGTYHFHRTKNTPIMLSDLENQGLRLRGPRILGRTFVGNLPAKMSTSTQGSTRISTRFEAHLLARVGFCLTVLVLNPLQSGTKQGMRSYGILSFCGVVLCVLKSTPKCQLLLWEPTGSWNFQMWMLSVVLVTNLAVIPVSILNQPPKHPETDTCVGKSWPQFQ